MRSRVIVGILLEVDIFAMAVEKDINWLSATEIVLLSSWLMSRLEEACMEAIASGLRE